MPFLVDDADYIRWCRNDLQAYQFCRIAGRIAHLADDIADGDSTDIKRDVAELLHITTILLPNDPFFIRNRESISAVMAASNLWWDASNEWVHHDDERARNWSNVHRFTYHQVFHHVALLVGGYEHARQVVREFNATYRWGEDTLAEWEAENGRVT